MMTVSLVQQTLPGLQGMLGNPGRQALGGIGEMYVARKLEREGYRVRFNVQGTRCGDLTVIDGDGVMTTVEVKTARQGRDGKWRFLLWKKGEQDYRNSDLVVCCCVTRSGDVIPFVIPVCEMTAKRSQIRITSDPRQYAGKWAVYRKYGQRLI